MQTLNKFSYGFGFLRRGYVLSRQIPGIKKWIAIPFIIDLLLLFFGLSWGWSFVSGWVGALVASWVVKGTILYALIYYPIYLFFSLGFFVVLLYGLFLLATVIASPFNAILAEKTLIHLGVMPPKTATMLEWVLVNLKMLGTSLVRAFLFAALGVLILVMSFIPFLNILGSYLSFLVVAFDSSDYALEVLQIPLRKRFSFLKKHLSEYTGMAGMLGLTLLVPGLTLLLLPISVVGASEVVAQLNRRTD